MVKTKTTGAKSTSSKTVTRGRSSAEDNTDKTLTSEELQAKYNKEVLRLKCSDLKLATTGSKKDLADRLHDEYNPIVIAPPPDIEIGDEEAPPPPPSNDDTVLYANDSADNNNNNNKRDPYKDDGD